MKIAGFQKLSLVDYPEKTACVLFTEGCNYRCPWCHNSTLVNEVINNYYSHEEIFEYIKKRENIIDAVVVSGGEPTIQKDLKEFLKCLRKYKILIKLDTNGSNPEVLKDLIKENLVDYVAMDIKNNFKKYPNTTAVENLNIDNIKKSIEILKEKNVDYEFRTTIIKEFHDIDDIKDITEIIGNSKYFIQNFVDNENVCYEGLHGFSDEELLNIKKIFPGLSIRGLAFTNEKEE